MLFGFRHVAGNHAGEHLGGASGEAATPLAASGGAALLSAAPRAEPQAPLVVPQAPQAPQAPRAPGARRFRIS